MAEVILPGTYISVRDEGLITAGRIATGYVGIVGTAARGPVGSVVTLGSFTEARAAFGEADPWRGGGKGELTLMRALELAFNNGASTVLAVRVAAQGAQGAKAAQLVLKKGSANLMTVAAKTPGTWGDALRVRVRAAAEGVAGRVVEVSLDDARESFQGANAGELAAAMAGSALVSATVQGAAGDLPDLVEEAALAGGKNGEGAGSADYGRGLEALENETVNLVLLAGQDAGMAETLQAHLNRTAQVRRERIGFIGSNGSDSADAIAAHSLNSDRLVYVGPGIRVRVTDPETRKDREVDLPGAYTAAAVAGLVASLPVQASPTNKPLAVSGLAAVFNQPKLEKLVQGRVLAVEKREGFRIVKGITTSTNPAWHQITTRRIVDYAMAGVRSSCNPYIGKLNNARVRSAMKATIDGFLTRMVQDEALVGYQLEVSATRAQEVAGEAIVTMTLQPTFSIDFIMVTMYLS
jgi:phage tail sheath protein FI